MMMIMRDVICRSCNCCVCRSPLMAWRASSVWPSSSTRTRQNRQLQGQDQGRLRAVLVVSIATTFLRRRRRRRRRRRQVGVILRSVDRGPVESLPSVPLATSFAQLQKPATTAFSSSYQPHLVEYQRDWHLGTTTLTTLQSSVPAALVTRP